MTLILPPSATPVRAAPASPAITSPTEGALLSFSFVTVAGTAEPGARVTVSVNTGGSLTTTAGSGGSWAIGRAFTDTTHTITAIARDTDGAASPPSPAIRFTVDTTGPPAPTVREPVHGSSTNQTAVTIAGTAEPASTITITDASVVAITTASGAGNFTAIAEFDPGVHEVTARAQDAAGNVGPAAMVRFTVDVTPPAVPVISSPTEGEIVAPASAIVSGLAEPFGTVHILRGTVVTAVSTAGYDGSWSVKLDVPNGPVGVRARTRDAAGNLGPETALRSFVIDGEIPVVTISTANGTIFTPFAQDANIRGSASDGYGLQRIVVDFYDLAGRNAGSFPARCDACGASTSATWSSALRVLVPGRYIVRAFAFDTVENKSLPAEISIVVARV